MAVVAIRTANGLYVPCEVSGCDMKAGVDQADLSQIRFRVVYCNDHFKEARLGRSMSVPERNAPKAKADLTVIIR